MWTQQSNGVSGLAVAIGPMLRASALAILSVVAQHATSHTASTVRWRRERTSCPGRARAREENSPNHRSLQL
jgi:hypothetical protein